MGCQVVVLFLGSILGSPWRVEIHQIFYSTPHTEWRQGSSTNRCVYPTPLQVHFLLADLL